MDHSKQTAGKVAVGILAWIGVAILAVIAAAAWGDFWGFIPVAIAVVVAWAVGEWVMGDQGEPEAER